MYRLVPRCPGSTVVASYKLYSVARSHLKVNTYHLYSQQSNEFTRIIRLVPPSEGLRWVVPNAHYEFCYYIYYFKKAD